MAVTDEESEFDPKKSMIYKLVRKMIPVTGRIDGQKFIIRKKEAWLSLHHDF